MNYAVETIDVCKHYPGVVANNHIHIHAREGSVLCLVGENGAGKSTLMNMLYGLERPTSGQIKIKGEVVNFASSRDAMQYKIGMVHQHFMLVDELSVLENIILGMEPKKGIRLDYKKAKEEVIALQKRYGMEVPIEKRTSTLAVGMQQKVEILKTLYRGADILIFDEPTAVLTPQETEELFTNIRLLAGQGKTIILITHKLDEVMQISDDIVIMRRGEVVETLKNEDTNAKDLAEHMVGKKLPKMQERAGTKGESVLQLQNISLNLGKGLHGLKHLDYTIHQGEIVGVAGISGNGQSELARIIAGLEKPTEGSVLLAGRDVTKHERRRRMIDGISYIPEDRKTEGLCLEWSIEQNAFAGYHILPQFNKKGGFINNQKVTQVAKEIIEQFDVRTPSHLTAIGSLSGGNQQKVVVARETINGPKLIIAAEPTRGVDIGAISFIHNHLIGLRNEGTAVLLISSDLDEIFKLSDRIIVLFEGEIVAEVSPQDVTREELGLYMSGAKRGNK
ncbi:MAG: ABC transporter ATP-binding protein [Niameybacter sp.]